MKRIQFWFKRSFLIINDIWSINIIRKNELNIFAVHSRLPPTHLIWWKRPLKVKFHFALECVGGDLVLRSKKFPSIPDKEKFVKINWIGSAAKLTPTDYENSSARFSDFKNFFKSEKKYLRVRKTRGFVFQVLCTRCLLLVKYFETFKTGKRSELAKLHRVKVFFSNDS